MVSLGQAARLAGVDKTTLTRAIKAGRLSATRRDDGGYLIDPAELSRVYEVKPERLDAVYRPRRRTTVEATIAAGGAEAELATRLALADAEVQSLKDMLAEIRQSRDDWKAQAERLTLAGPAIAPPPAQEALPGPDKRRPWWRRLAQAGSHERRGRSGEDV
jgi:hypothetical protein